MKNGYDQFFKEARKAAGSGHSIDLKSKSKPKAKSVKPQHQFSTSHPSFELSEEDLEKQLKNRMGMTTPKKKKRKSIPWKLMGISFIGLVGTAWGVQNLELVEDTLKRVEISYLGNAFADEKAPAKKPDAKATEPAAAAKADKAGEKKDGTATPLEGDKVAKNEVGGEGLSNDEIDHLTKLNDRKKELDEKEEELARVEQELQAQKEELEKRLKDLEGVRRGISSVLEEKVKVDEKKLDTLVLIYSDMKAPQAAKVFETMDEDLAVGILGRMKKKNAADIMTLLKAEKAQALTEKFAGYKRK